ncbi:serine protease HTR4-like [Oppia nitens]|uniref:serine protease HTR4-like n=1 Tax=Oppia nitens TaxID=1686743 RepID=UPI0023DCE4DE|nr:serine protease HTR4-like [Oppia nitens]
MYKYLMTLRCLRHTIVGTVITSIHYFYHRKHTNQFDGPSNWSLSTIMPLFCLNRAHLKHKEWDQIFTEGIRKCVLVYILGRDFRETVSGTGTIIVKHEDYKWIITNAHVVGQVSTISIHGNQVKGQVIFADPSVDLALIECEPIDKLKEFKIATKRQVFGDDLVTIGYMSWYVHSGHDIINCPDSLYLANENNAYRIICSPYTRQIHHKAIEPSGWSGGPTINMMGQLIGINNGMSRVMGSFSIPVHTYLLDFLKRAEEYRKNQEIRRKFERSIKLGVELDVRYNDNNLIIKNKFVDTNININDKLVEINGQPMETLNQLKDILNRLDDNSVLSITLVSQTSEHPDSKTVNISALDLSLI